MSSRYKFFRESWNKDFRHMQKTLPDKSLEDTFQGEDDLTYEIPLKHRYRPDLISSFFYKDPKLYWVLIYANGFYNSPEDFEVSVKIRVPRYERVLSII